MIKDLKLEVISDEELLSVQAGGTVEDLVARIMFAKATYLGDILP